MLNLRPNDVDLGAIALFGSDRIVTLPWLLYQKLGSYRTADAAGLALLLGAATMALMIIADRLGNRSGTAPLAGRQLR